MSEFISYLQYEHALLVDWASWEDIKGFANSNFFTTLIGALAGAFFGAHAAQRIAARAKMRDDLRRDIKLTNAAISAVFSIINSALALKRQNVKPVKDFYDTQVDGWNQHMAGLQAGTIPQNTVFQFVTDFRRLPILTVPADSLKEFLFSELTVDSRCMALVSEVKSTLVTLNGSIELRNSLINNYKINNIHGRQLMDLYFGHPDPYGNINEEYPNTMDAISSFNDNLIWFSNQLSKDLTVHGNKQALILKKRFRENPPSIKELDFSKSDDIMPDDSEYKEWLTAFVPRTKKTKLIWLIETAQNKVKSYWSR